MKVVVVYNMKSGGNKSLNDLKKACDAAELDVEKYIAVSAKLRTNLKPYIKKNAVIVGIGGDGTLSAIAGMLAGTKATFAPIAGGTLNHFTKDLGVDQDLESALGNVAKKRLHVIDTAVCNGRVFINNSSIGVYPSSLQVRERFEGYIGKWLAAIMAGFHAFFSLRTYRVKINNEMINTPFVFIGNGVYDIGTPGIAQRTDIKHGTLSVFVAKTVSRWKLLKIALLAVIGRAAMLDEFDVFTTKSLTISSRRARLSVSTDGELGHEPTPLKYEIQPKSLRVYY
jgi:diacylglycerol kinase family enzyme